MKFGLFIIILVAIIILYPIVTKIMVNAIFKEKSENNRQIIIERINKIGKYIFVYSFLTFIAFLILVPFYWMINISLQDFKELGQRNASLYPGHLLGKFNPLFKNYSAVFNIESFKLWQYIGNTLWVAIWSILGTIVTTVFAAYAFARLNFRGREVLFLCFLSTMMIPGEMMVISNFVTISNLGWYDSFLAMIVPFWVSTYYIYLLRQNFKQIPNELYYAAKVDGTGDLKYLFKIMIPIALPTIITISILKLMGTWNSYIWPRLVTDSNGNRRMLTEALRSENFAFQYDDAGNLIPGNTAGETRTNVTIQMAATSVVTLPLLVLFITMRKYIMRGVSRSGIKG